MIADSLRVEFRTRREIVVSGAGMALGLVMQRQVAKTNRFAIARPVKDQACDTPRAGEIGHAAEVLDLLGYVETVEK